MEVLNLALDSGINYLDTTQVYGGGNSENLGGRSDEDAPQRRVPGNDPKTVARTADDVRRRLGEMEYSLQANAKTKDDTSAPGRDQQFRYINEQVKKSLGRGEPVVSVDTKKKERVGNFKNSGKTWRRKGQPLEVNVYDYPQLGVGTAIPYGAYDVQRNEGFVNVGTTHDTAEFAVESLRRWWRLFGRRHYPHARRLLVCADGGGSNGSRNRA